MSTLQLIKNALTEKFINAKIEGTGSLAPRPGYYYIRKMYYKPIGVFGEVLIAQVNWKQNYENDFVEDAVFEIALSNLYSATPEDTINLEKDDLLEKVIYVDSPMILERSFHGEVKNVLSCQWRFINEPPHFINNASIFSSAFGNSENGKEAYQSLLNNSLYDLEFALEIEALCSYNKDVIVDDYAYENQDFSGFMEEEDAPDAPEKDDETENSQDVK